MSNRISQRIVLTCGVVAFVASTLGAVFYLPTPFGQKNPDASTEVKSTPVAFPALTIAPKRNQVPPELHWFFQRFPEISEQAVMRSKNRHTFLVHDPAQKRQYVVSLGQTQRRVEVYSAGPEKNSPRPSLQIE